MQEILYIYSCKQVYSTNYITPQLIKKEKQEMKQKINLKQLEKNTVAGIFQTGLVEIEIGLIFMVATLAMLFNDIRYYIDILYIVPVIFIILAVKYIYEPRMGVAKFTKKRVRKRMSMMITVTIFLVVMVSLRFIGNSTPIVEFINPRWIISGIILSICFAIAYFLSFDRMYFYAFLLTGAFNLSEEIRENPGVISEGGYAYLLAAIVLTVIGSIYLIRFLKKYQTSEAI